jgi:hypothetical protein
MERKLADFEAMSTMDLYEEVLDLEMGDGWDGMSSKKNDRERTAAKSVFEKRLARIDELETTLTELMLVIPKETQDADWWPDNLKQLFQKAQTFT